MVKTDLGDPSNGSTATIQGTSSPVTVNIYVIGGPITGTNDIHYYCDPTYTADWGHISAASGQPAGTTYSWSISGNAQLVQDSAYPSPVDATYAGKQPGSSKQGDVTATVTYALNGVSVASPPFLITVHAPTTFVAGKVVQPTQTYTGPDDYGFSGAELPFTILDGLGQAITGANWDEQWELQGNGQGPGPGITGGNPLDSTGSSIDGFSKDGDPAPTSTTNPKGSIVYGPLTHRYSVTDEGGGQSGGDVGCLVQTYTNVYYYTYGMVGNGF